MSIKREAFYLDKSLPVMPQVCKIVRDGNGCLTEIMLTPQFYLQMLSEIKQTQEIKDVPENHIWMIGDVIDQDHPEYRVEVTMAMYDPETKDCADAWSEI